MMLVAAQVSGSDGGLGRVGELARDIKLSHTVFAMPFALLGAFLAAGVGGGGLPTLWMVVLVVVCMVAGRTAAMSMNRWADARIDVGNPRTAGRAIPGGRLTRRFMFGAAVVSGLALVAAASGFWWLYGNAWPVLLSPVILLWLGFYSFTKRFTSLCHVVLGTTLAISPLAAAVAVNPGYLAQAGPYLLAGMVACWVAGFDVIYALQDVEADRETGVFSMPARWGIGRALWASRALHLGSVAMLVGLWWRTPQLGAGFAVGIVIVAGLLVVEHAMVWGGGTRRINAAFFTVNGVISLVLGGLGVVDVLCALG